MNRADVSSISAGRNCYSGILQRFQVLERDIVGFLDPIERVFRLGQRRLDPVRQFIRRNLCHIKRRDHFGISPRFFFRGQI